jgi:hypothetical protein
MLCWMTGEKQLESSLTSWGFHLVQYSPFWQKIWACKIHPKTAKYQQKETCLAVARDLLQCADQDTNFIKTIITSDESWVCRYDLETKAQTSQWKTLGLWGQKGTPSSEQGVSDVNSFLQSRRYHSPWVHTRWSYH